MLTEPRTINVLGTDIKVQFREKKQDKSLEECDGYFYESGMAHCSSCAENWAANEEMVDWFAIQAPKICKVFREQKLV